MSLNPLSHFYKTKLMTQYNFLFIYYTCLFTPVFLSIITFISIAPDLPYFKFSTLQYLRILFCPYEYLKTASLSFSFTLLRFLYFVPCFLPSFLFAFSVYTSSCTSLYAFSFRFRSSCPALVL